MRTKTRSIWFSGSYESMAFYTNYGSDHRGNIYLYAKQFCYPTASRNDIFTEFVVLEHVFRKHFKYNKQQHRWELDLNVQTLKLNNICIKQITHHIEREHLQQLTKAV